MNGQSSKCSQAGIDCSHVGMMPILQGHISSIFIWLHMRIQIVVPVLSRACIFVPCRSARSGLLQVPTCQSTQLIVPSMSSKNSRTRTKAMKVARVAIGETQGNLCIMPWCEWPWDDAAHIEPSGLGGRPSTNVHTNIVGMCKGCHAIFDGRTLQGRQYMMKSLLKAWLDCR